MGQFAVFDFAAAFVGMYYLAPHIKMQRETALWLALPLGIVTHKLIGTETPLNQMVAGDSPNRLAQILIAVCLYKGLLDPRIGLLK